MNTDELFIDANRLPRPLTKPEVYQLLNKMQQGDEQARNKLVEHNIRLVLYEVTNRFGTVEYDKKELVSIGNLGLMKAITTFDISKKVEFATYATRCIDNEILMFLRKIKKFKNDDSLDKTINYDKNGNELKIEDILVCDVDLIEEYTNNETHRIIREIVKDLPERDREIIMLHFGFYNDKIHTQQEIAKIFSISQSYVSRLVKKIIKIIGKQLEAKEIIELRKEPTLKEKRKINKKSVKISNQVQKTSKKEGINTLKDISQPINIEQTSKLEFLETSIYDSDNKYINKDTFKIILNLLSTEKINQIKSSLTLKEVIVIYLKLGYIDGKCFSTSAISEFLGIEQKEVIDITKKVLLLYKDSINQLIDDGIDIITESQKNLVIK